MLSLGIYGILVSGWASSNRFALIGSLRGAAQLVSYEVALGLSLVGLIMVFPSLSLSRIVDFQGGLLFGFLPKWGIFLQPLGFAVFYLAGMAETKRVPFDMPEGESEIIGFYTEYGGLKFGLFMFTDFLEVIVLSAMATTLFFGGWQVPWLGDAGFAFPWGGRIAVAPWAVTVLQRPVLQPEGLLLLLAPDPDALDLPALPLRPDHGPRLEGPRPPRRRQHPRDRARPGGAIGEP